MRTRKRKNQKLILALLIGVVAVCSTAVRNSATPQIVGYDSHFVKDGDTLWGIARDLVGDSMDVRAVIYEIRKKNGISSNLQIGQEIYVPVYE